MEPTHETIGYRPVSMIAIAAAVAGVLSSLAVTTPLLWILPLIGIVVAIAGLVDVGRPGAEKAGRAAALLGLALSVGFGAQAVTTVVVSRTIAQSRARAVASMWCDAVRQNRLADAQSMMSPHLLSAAADEEPSLGSSPAVMAIRGCGDPAVCTVESMGRDEETGERWGVRLRLSPGVDGGAVEVRLQLQPESVQEPMQRVERWTISQVELGP